MNPFKHKKKMPAWAYEICIFLIITWGAIAIGSFFLGMWKESFVKEQARASEKTCIKFLKGDSLFKLTIGNQAYNIKEDGYMNELDFSTLHWINREVLKSGNCIWVYLPKGAREWNENHYKR